MASGRYVRASGGGKVRASSRHSFTEGTQTYFWLFYVAASVDSNFRASDLFGRCCTCFPTIYSPTQQAESKETVQLFVAEDALNVGPIWETEQFSWTVPVRNREPELIEVESISSTCNCLSIEPRSFSLGPGERRDLQLRIDLTSDPEPTGNFCRPNDTGVER